MCSRFGVSAGARWDECCQCWCSENGLAYDMNKQGGWTVLPESRVNAFLTALLEVGLESAQYALALKVERGRG
jgi:hypothetical protein